MQVPFLETVIASEILNLTREKKKIREREAEINTKRMTRPIFSILYTDSSIHSGISNEFIIFHQKMIF